MVRSAVYQKMLGTPKTGFEKAFKNEGQYFKGMK